MAFVRVQGTGSARISPGHSLGVTLTGVVAGNVLIAIANSAVTTTIADSQSNTWVSAVVSGRVTIWYSVVTTGGTVTVTATSSQSNFLDLSLEEWSYSGLLSLDATATGTGTSAAPATGGLSLSRTALVVAGFDVVTPSLTYTAGSGFTSGYSTDAAVIGEPFFCEYNAAQVATPVAPGCTLSGSSAWTGASAAFVAVTSGISGSTVLTVTSGPAATLARTGGPDSVASAGNNPRTGVLARSDTRDSLAASATMTAAAGLSRPEARDNLTASAGQFAAATFARTGGTDALAAVGIAGSAGPVATGTFARTDVADALAAPGDAGVHGSISRTGGADTLAAPASPGVVGSIARTEPRDALAAAGSMASIATLAVTPAGDDTLSTGSDLQYHVYANSGDGGPINYTTPVATTGLLTWTSGVLACDADWRFGVRCFDTVSGLEEENLDCAVEIILDPGCTDITNRPRPPTGLRAFAVAP